MKPPLVFRRSVTAGREAGAFQPCIPKKPVHTGVFSVCLKLSCAENEDLYKNGDFVRQIIFSRFIDKRQCACVP